MRLLSPAKINLRLKVEGRREDGYHLLSMLNIMSDFCDKIELNFSHNSGIELEVRAEDPLPSNRENYAFLAAEKFLEEFDLKKGIKIKLDKKIPAGSGLAGGSSNAAVVLKALKEYFTPILIKDREISAGEIDLRVRNIAQAIGSDLMFFFSNGCAVVGGTGELVRDVEIAFLKNLSFVLLLPNFPVSSSLIYSSLRKSKLTFQKDHKLLDVFPALNASDEESYNNLLQLVDNDLSLITRQEFPQMRDILNKAENLKNFVACMSGSGSAVFMLSRKNIHMTAQEENMIRSEFSAMPLRIIRCGYFKRYSLKS